MYRKLRNHTFNGTLDMGDSTGQQLVLVNFEDNEISDLALHSKYQNSLKWEDLWVLNLINPTYSLSFFWAGMYFALTFGNVLITAWLETQFAPCGISLTLIFVTNFNGQPENLTSLVLLNGNNPCTVRSSVLWVASVHFHMKGSATMFHELETYLWQKLGLNPGSVSLQNISFWLWWLRQSCFFWATQAVWTVLLYPAALWLPWWRIDAFTCSLSNALLPLRSLTNCKNPMCVCQI